MSDTAQTIDHCGFIAVVGRPNAGKSTLVNAVVGEHVAIVSAIAQTTRRPVRAAVNHGTSQLVFVDLPGSQTPVDVMTARMQQAVRDSLADVDTVLWCIDATAKPKHGERAMADAVFSSETPVVIALTKLDRVSPTVQAERILAISEIIGERPYRALVPVSALEGTGMDSLLDELISTLPTGVALFPSDISTDMRTEERIAEYVREAALGHLRDELPHASIAEVEEIDYDDDLWRVTCTIWVEKESQIGIVVGAGGRTIRDIGIAARHSIEQAFAVHCHLDLRVKRKRRWRDNEGELSRLGL